MKNPEGYFEDIHIWSGITANCSSIGWHWTLLYALIITHSIISRCSNLTRIIGLCNSCEMQRNNYFSAVACPVEVSGIRLTDHIRKANICLSEFLPVLGMKTKWKLPNLVIFQDRPKFSRINRKLSPRPLEWWLTMIYPNKYSKHALPLFYFYTQNRYEPPKTGIFFLETLGLLRLSASCFDSFRDKNVNKRYYEIKPIKNYTFCI